MSANALISIPVVLGIVLLVTVDLLSSHQEVGLLASLVKRKSQITFRKTKSPLSMNIPKVKMFPYFSLSYWWRRWGTAPHVLPTILGNPRRIVNGLFSGQPVKV